MLFRSEIHAGDRLTDGSINPHDLLEIKGPQAVEAYITSEVQKVYRLQGVDIDDRHIEIIIHQMMQKAKITDQGNSEFLPGMLVNKRIAELTNDQLLAQDKEPMKWKHTVLGITKASIASDSFLSAASFQETTRVLTDASLKGKVDYLLGLKENIIIGKLIPAGTGMKRYARKEIMYEGMEDDLARIRGLRAQAREDLDDEEREEIDESQDALLE